MSPKVWIAVLCTVISSALIATVAIVATHHSSPARPHSTAVGQHQPRQASGRPQVAQFSSIPALPVLAKSAKPTVVDGNLVYRNAAPDTSFTVRSRGSGASQTLITISGNRAPTSFGFTLPLPAGMQYRLNTNGSIDVIKTGTGQIIGSISAPWARDANGKTVATRYTLKGNVIMQTVAYRGAAFPVVADPSVYWHWWGYQVYFSKWETGVIAGGLQVAKEYFGWDGWLAVGVWVATGLAAWAISHGYCLALNSFWNGTTIPWVYRC